MEKNIKKILLMIFVFIFLQKTWNNFTVWTMTWMCLQGSAKGVDLSKVIRLLEDPLTVS